MRLLACFAAAVAVAFLILAPVAVAADPSPGRDQVLISVRGDVTLPADQSADVIVVVEGNATIAGSARSLIVVDGAATVAGAQVETVWAIRSTVELQPGTVVSGDVRTLDATVHKLGDAVVLGDVKEITPELATIGAVLAPVAILFLIGLALATIAAGLLLAGVASRQVRDTQLLISREPVPTLVVGLAGLILVPAVSVLLIVSILGAPLGLGILFVVWPLVAYVGYLVAGIWVGDWILARTDPGRVREKPYLASMIGLGVLQAIGLVPLVGLLTAVASVFGFGAVLLAAWRAITRRPETGQQVPIAEPMPVG
jgi:hypothetical protein